MDVSSNTCRLCLLENAVIKIFGNKKSNIVEMIKECCQFEIAKEDDLPQKVCLECLTTLKMCYEFILKCIGNNNELILINGIKIDKQMVGIEEKYTIKCESNKYPNNVETSNYYNEDYIINNDNKTIVNKQPTENNNNKERKRKANTKNMIKEKLKDVRKKKIKCANENIEKPIIPKQSDVNSKINGERISDKIVCDLCGKSIRRGHMWDHSNTHAVVKNFTCEHCLKKFKVRADMMKHIKFVHQDNSVVCDICKKVYSSRITLKKHMAIVHSTVRDVYTCDVCNRKYKVKSFLKMHMRTHTKERPYQCRFCESTFSMTKCKIEHERLHLGITPYKCPSCPKAFTQLSNMKSHFKHNHKDINFSEVYKPAPRRVRISTPSNEVLAVTAVNSDS